MIEVVETSNMEKAESGMATRVLREILHTPAFKELLKISLSEAVPGKGRELAKTFFWEDVDLSLSLMTSSSRSINFVLEFLDELARQLQSFPPDTLQNFLSQMANSVDKEILRSLSDNGTHLLEELLWKNQANLQHLKESFIEVLNSTIRAVAKTIERLEEETSEAPPGVKKGLDEKAIADLVNASTRWIAKTTTERPDLLRQVASHLDLQALRKAVEGGFNAILDAGLLANFIFWIGGAALSGLMKRWKNRFVG
jgi:hypothetical protein